MPAAPPERLIIDRLETPIGTLTFVVDQAGVLRSVDWADHESRMRRLLRRHCGPVEPQPGAAPAVVRRAFEAYFAGQRDALARLPWRTSGTPFQVSVWRALCEIPPGRTLSYRELAGRVGRPAAVRAVGMANGANPIGLVAPCHRVIGSDGSLTGYGGGLDRKRWLLSHEQAAG